LPRLGRAGGRFHLPAFRRPKAFLVSTWVTSASGTILAPVLAELIMPLRPDEM